MNSNDYNVCADNVRKVIKQILTLYLLDKEEFSFLDDICTPFGIESYERRCDILRYSIITLSVLGIISFVRSPSVFVIHGEKLMPVAKELFS